MKRRVLVLPLADQTNYKEEHLDELTTKRLISRLENSGTIIAVDPHTLDLPGDPSKPDVMRSLNELYGIQAVIKGALSDVYSSTSKIDGGKIKRYPSPSPRYLSTSITPKQARCSVAFTASNPFFLSKENGDMSSEKAKVRAIDLAIELMADDLLKTLLNLDWHARIASVENDRIISMPAGCRAFKKGTSSRYSPRGPGRRQRDKPNPGKDQGRLQRGDRSCRGFRGRRLVGKGRQGGIVCAHRPRIPETEVIPAFSALWGPVPAGPEQA